MKEQNSKPWSKRVAKLVEQVRENPIKRFPNEEYSDEDLREILTTMRKRMDDAQANPKSEDTYGTDSGDYRDAYDILQRMADQRGIVID